MAILNITPDSFYEGSRFVTETEILTQAEKVLTEGADIIDIGGYSSRPGADDISIQEESSRVGNAIKVILKKFPAAHISIDTFRSEVARVAVGEGASMINDISGGELDEKMFDTVAELQVPYILMHMRGNPKNMTKLIQYDDLLKDLIHYFQRKNSALMELGVKDIIIDPGFGFAKTREQNFLMLNSLETFKILGKPLMVGLSRKSMIWKTLQTRPEEALNGTSALHAIALLKGADILRVHDVKESVEVVKLLVELNVASGGSGHELDDKLK